MSCIKTGCIFQWTIENFQSLPLVTEKLISPPFSFNSIPDTEWHMELQNLVNLSGCYLKRSSAIIPVKLKYRLTVQFDDVTERSDEMRLEFPIGKDTKLLRKIVYEGINKKIFGNRNLVLVCRFDGDYFEHKKTKFYYARTSVKVEICKKELLLDLKKVRLSEENVYKHSIVDCTTESYLRVTKVPCTLADLSLVSTVTKYPQALLTNVCLYNRGGKIVGTGKGLYHFYKNCKKQVIQFEGDKEKPITHYLGDSELMISAQFEVSYDLFTYMERTEDLTCIEKLDGKVYELNPYAPLKEGNLNYKIRVCDQVFHANKDYLREISPYFQNLIDQNENECEISEIINVDKISFEKLFDILHCKESLSNYREYSDLNCFYKLSQQFQFVPLIKALSRSLVSVFSVSNISEIFLLASNYNDQVLWTAAQNYFIVHSKDVLDQQTWKDFSENEPKLAAEVIVEAIKTSQ